MPLKQEIHSLLIDFISELEQTSLLWQAAVLAISLLLAWWLSHVFQKRSSIGEGAWRLALEGLNRIAFPLIALILVVAGKTILGQTFHVNLLNLAVPLLLSFMLIRLSAYLLRQIFVPGGFLQTSERLITWVIWIGLALHITGFLPTIALAMDQLGFNMGRQRVSLLLVVQGLFSVAVTLLLAVWLGRVLQNRILHAHTLDLSLRMVLSKLVGTLLIVIGILIALPLAGIDITILSVFGGALGVGLGLGLQKIASNYISGFIILLERSIRIGDMITVDNRYGEVTQMSTRYTVLKNLDGTEAIIPNDIFISSSVLNHSFSSREVRFTLPIQVGYDSDLDVAMGILIKAAEGNPRILNEPRPNVLVKQFADNGIELELVAWLADPEEGQGLLRSDLNLEIWRQLRAHKIEIPYPRRDIKIIRDPPKIPLA